MKNLFFLHTSSKYLTGLRLPMLAALVNAGYKVTAFAPDMLENAKAELLRNGIKGESLPLDASGFNVWRDIKNLIRIVRIIRSAKPDIVFTNNIKPVAFGSIAAALAGVPHRYALVGGLGYAFTNVPDERASRKRFVAKCVASVLYAVAFRLCRKVIFHNVDDMTMMVEKGICPRKKASVVLGSGVNVNYYVPSDRPPLSSFVFVGRLLKDKGVREYLEAAKRTKKQYPNAKFYLVGDVDTNPSAIDKGEVSDYVRSGDVVWVGRVDDVRPYLQESSVFVLPSYREGVPRSTLEAMACGLAIITTDAPGCRETVIHGQNGMLVPVMNAEKISEAMCEMLKNPEVVLEMGKSSRAMVLERFSVEKINNDILKLLEVSA